MVERHANHVRNVSASEGRINYSDPPKTINTVFECALNGYVNFI